MKIESEKPFSIQPTQSALEKPVAGGTLQAKMKRIAQKTAEEILFQLEIKEKTPLQEALSAAKLGRFLMLKTIL